MAIDLATIADRIAVEQHLYLYAHLLDSHQFARVPEEVFTEDADVDFGGQRVVGREQIRAFVNGLPGAMRGTSHNISNVIIEIDGDEARSSIKLTAWHWFNKPGGGDYDATDLLAVGGYQDRLRRTPAGWRIWQRRGLSFGSGIGVGVVPPELYPIFDGMRGRLPDWP